MWGTSPKGCRNNTKDVGSSVPPESPLSGEGSPPHYTNVLNVLNVVGSQNGSKKDSKQNIKSKKTAVLDEWL